MHKLHRRTFLAGTSLAAIAASMGFALPTAPRNPKDLERLKQRVQFTRDGAFLDELFHTRRMFGGGMPQVWPFAAIALKYAGQFPEAYKKANENTAQLFGLLNIHKEFKAERIVDGTNVFRLQLNGPAASDFQDKLHAMNIDLPAPAQEFNGFFLKINPTINRMVPEKIVSAFLKCC